MRVIIILVALILVCTVFFIRSPMWKTQTLVAKLSKKGDGREHEVGDGAGASQGAQPILTQPPVVRQEQKVKEEAMTMLFYRFKQRPVPEGLGTVDAASNAVYKSVKESEKEATEAFWSALDVPIERRRVHVEVLQFSDKGDAGFSLPVLLSELGQIIGQNSTTSYTTSGLAVGFLTQQAATATGQFVQAIGALFLQARVSAKVRSRLETTVWLTSGQPLRYEDFNEQQVGSVTTTTTGTTQSNQTREVGFNFTVTPSFVPESTHLIYSISDTMPTSETTAGGNTVSGDVYLSTKPAVAVTALRTDDTRSTSKLLGIPVGFEHTPVHTEFMVIFTLVNNSHQKGK